MVALSAPRASLWGLDLWIENYAGVENPGAEFVRAELRRLGHDGPLVLVEGDSRQTLPALLASSPGLSFDLVTVDGDHTAEGAVRDLLTVLPCISPGGVLLFDDISHPSHRYLADCWAGTVGAHPDFETATYSASGDGIAVAIRKPVNETPRHADPLDAVRRVERILSEERQQTIERLTALLQESDADRAARLKAMEQLTAWLVDSQADRAACAETIVQLQERLRDAEARLNQTTDPSGLAPHTS
jgi:hypothetical protein